MLISIKNTNRYKFNYTLNAIKLIDQFFNFIMASICFGKTWFTLQLTLSSPSFSGHAVQGVGFHPPPHNFLSFYQNLMKLCTIDHLGILYLSVVVHCT